MNNIIEYRKFIKTLILLTFFSLVLSIFTDSIDIWSYSCVLIILCLINAVQYKILKKQNV